MARSIVGYSVIAVIGVLALKLLLWVLGAAFSLLVLLFWLAVILIGVYLVLRVVRPRSAPSASETVEGSVQAAPDEEVAD